MQHRNGDAVTVGNMTRTVKPHVYLARLQEVEKYVRAGTLDKPAVAYVTNALTIMVATENPEHIVALSDLGSHALMLALPNSTFEGIARQIKESLRKPGDQR